MNCDIAPNKPQIYSRLEIYKGLEFKGEKIGGPTSYCCLGTTARYIIAARPNQGGNPVGRSCAPEMRLIEEGYGAACRTTSEEASVNTAAMYEDGSAKFW